MSCEWKDSGVAGTILCTSGIGVDLTLIMCTSFSTSREESRFSTCPELRSPFLASYVCTGFLKSNVSNLKVAIGKSFPAFIDAAIQAALRTGMPRSGSLQKEGGSRKRRSPAQQKDAPTSVVVDLPVYRIPRLLSVYPFRRRAGLLACLCAMLETTRRFQGHEANREMKEGARKTLVLNVWSDR